MLRYKLQTLNTAILTLCLSATAFAADPAVKAETLPPSKEKAARASSPPVPNKDGSYGEKFEVPKELFDLSQSGLQDLRAQIASREVVVKGKVNAVCPKKGCWMQVDGKDFPYRVTFKDYGFFVPTQLVGREVALKGHFVPHKESVAEQKHLAEDARRPKAEIDAITTEKETLRFVATGVRAL